MRNFAKGLLLFFPALFIVNFAFAQVLHLKSGRVVEGDVVEKTEEYIRVEVDGVGLTYYREDIASIEGWEEVDPVDSEQSKIDEQFYAFSLGSHQAGENSVEFDFPGGMDTLYLFNLQEWVGPRPEEARLVVNLYDNNQKLLSQGKSGCLSSQFRSFGSIFFSEISKENIESVAYFSFSVDSCASGRDE